MIVALLALVLAAGGVTYAAIPDASGTIHGCYNNHGSLRVIDTGASPAQRCRANETALDWPAGTVPGGSGGTVSALVRLAAGETKTVLQRGPFSLTATCTEIGPNNFRVELQFRSSEAGTAFSGIDAPFPADTPFPFLQQMGTEEVREATFVHIVAPSGATWALSASDGVHTFGSDCAAAATATGI
jgi:hypothetical protein